VDITQLQNATNVVLHKGDNHIYRNRQLSSKLDLSSYNKIRGITDDYVEVDGLVRFDTLLEYTLVHGYMPQVVPELRSITIGGAISGVGLESSSFKFGLFHDTVTEYTVITGNGDIIVCNNQTNAELFFGMPGSYGTFGYVLNAKVNIMKVKPFVFIQNEHYTDPVEFISAMEEYKYDKGGIDFVDGTIFDKSTMYISRAKFVDKIPTTPSVYGVDIYYKSIPEKQNDYMTIKDYVWRYDSNYFYLGGDANDVFQNKIFRTVFRPFLRSDYMRLFGTNFITRYLVRWLMVDSEPIVNDLSIDISAFPSFLEWYDTHINTYPVWICPLHTQRDTYFMEKNHFSVDFGIGFGVYKCDETKSDKMYYRKLIDRKMYDNGSKKGLYSTTTLTYEQFNRLYNPNNVYEKLKTMYDPYGRFPTLYDKVCLNK
jgi:hypothetical protein